MRIAAVMVVVLILAVAIGYFVKRATAGGGPEISIAPPWVKVVADAADAEVTPPFVIEDDPECARGKCIYLPEGPGGSELNPKLRTAPYPDGRPVHYQEIRQKKHQGKTLYPNGTFRIPFEVKEPGEYVLWARVWWGPGKACANSFYVMIDPRKEPVDADGNGEYDDEVVPYIFGEDGTYMAWHWLKLQDAKFKLDAGRHVIYGCNREDGIRIDRFLLVKVDPALGEYYPTGTEEE